MKYYVGIRETIIDRARQASSAALNPDFVTKLLQHPKNASKGSGNDLKKAMQTLIRAGLIQIGATGLEPATS